MDFVKTKIYPPIKDAILLERPNLTARLNQWPDKKLILLSASAGSGKTSLISMWIHKLLGGTNSCNIAWYTLDKHDNDPIRFVRYLLFSLQEAGYCGFSEKLNRISEMYNMHLTETLAHIVSMLIDDDDKNPLLIIFDDYQNIYSREIHEGMNFLLRYLPSHIHIAILTRNDPPLNLSSLRVKEQVIDIRTEDLNFDYAESARFLSNYLQTKLDHDTIATLHRKTEGWITGLQLTALSLRNRNKSKNMQMIEGNRLIIDYLMEEVYSQLPGKMQEFLLQTSILNHFTVPLCEYITRMTESYELIDILRRDNLFLIPLDQEGEWFRYQNQFSYFLQKRLSMEHQDKIYELHTRAAHWYYKQKLRHEAFDHAVLSQDPELVNKISEDYIEELWIAGEHALLLERISQIPLSVMEENAHLRLFWALLRMDYGKIDTELVKTVFSESDKNYSSKELGMLETIRASYGNIIQKSEIIEKHASSAIEHFSHSNPVWQNNAICVLARTYYISGNLLDAEKYFRLAYRESILNRNKNIDYQAAFHLADTLRSQGRFKEAKILCQEKLKEIESCSLYQLLYTGSFYSVLGEISCEENDIKSALAYGVKSIKLAEQRNNSLSLCISYKKLLNAYLAIRDYEKIKSILNKLLTLKNNTFLPPWIETTIRLAQSVLYMLNGKNEEAIQILQPPSLNLYPGIKFTNEDIRELLFLARLYLYTGNPEKAAPIIEKLKNLLARNHRWTAYLNCLISDALYWDQVGNKVKAKKSIHEALELGSKKGYLRIFINAGPLLQPLMSKMSRMNELSRYGINILGYIEADLSARSDTNSAKPLLDPLSPREYEILKLLPTKLSYPEIADRLYISYSTVRSHVKNIYMKLDAHSRLEAVNIGRLHGLMD
ncbi:MAG: LuxR C-terminal-related transcriptional regulator [Bacillota bacterium]|nr:LuxR C-terminal-related transcriptional regulator [Bacillota bacterium]